MNLILSSRFIKNNWGKLKKYFPEFSDAGSAIEAIKHGDVNRAGAKLHIVDKLPVFDIPVAVEAA